MKKKACPNPNFSVTSPHTPHKRGVDPINSKDITTKKMMLHGQEVIVKVLPEVPHHDRKHCVHVVGFASFNSVSLSVPGKRSGAP